MKDTSTPEACLVIQLVVLNMKILFRNVHTNVNYEACNDNCSIKAVEFGFEETGLAVSNNRSAERVLLT